ncbi:glycine cleavage system protein T, partial [Corynebacterium bovis]
MTGTPRRTALHPVHEALGARFTDFGGWDMPLKYANELDE